KNVILLSGDKHMLSSVHEKFMSGFAKLKNRSEDDKGDLVQTIIIIAGFAVAAVVIIGALSSTLMHKGQATAECIAGSSSFTTGTEARTNCKTADDTAKGNAQTDIDASFADD